MSICFNLRQGNHSQSKQKPEADLMRNSQFLILHAAQWLTLNPDSGLHPQHFFLFLRWAIQVPQFIPHGAIMILSNDIGLGNLNQTFELIKLFISDICNFRCLRKSMIIDFKVIVLSGPEIHSFSSLSSFTLLIIWQK